MRGRREPPVRAITEGRLIAPDPKLDRLHQRAFAAAPDGRRPMGVHVIPNAHVRRTGRLVVARVRRRPVGYALSHPPAGEDPDHPRWYLEAIAVDPDHQRQGVGTSLLMAIAAVSLSAGARTLDAAPLVGEGEEERQAWLLAMGFVPLERRTFRFHLTR